MTGTLPRLARVLAWLALFGLSGPGRAASIDDLVHAYPQVLSGFDGVNLVWRDGTRMPVGPAHAGPMPEDGTEDASILDQLATPYPAGAPLLPPDNDPGRSRNKALFEKMYGDCAAGQVAPNLVRIAWLPKSWGHEVTITRVNGVDRQLEAVSRELDELPAEERKFLHPIGGTYNCRRVAGSGRTSMHAWGAAIDLNTAYADYWRWSTRTAAEPIYRNRIPPEIVAIFERHGFIWGGRWSHFDTMHFEYRPELLGAFASPATVSHGQAAD